MQLVCGDEQVQQHGLFLLGRLRPEQSYTAKELESHAAQVVQPGKTFLRRMFELKSRMSQSRTRIRLNAGIRSDI